MQKWAGTCEDLPVVKGSEHFHTLIGTSGFYKNFGSLAVFFQVFPWIPACPAEGDKYLNEGVISCSSLIHELFHYPPVMTRCLFFSHSGFIPSYPLQLFPELNFPGNLPVFVFWEAFVFLVFIVNSLRLDRLYSQTGVSFSWSFWTPLEVFPGK